MKKTLFVSVLIGIVALTGCHKDEATPKVIDNTKKIVGTWKLNETSDPAGMPLEELYIFGADGIFNFTRKTNSSGRLQSIGSGSWRFTNNEQTQLEIETVGSVLYYIDKLDEAELILRQSSGGITEKFLKQ